MTSPMSCRSRCFPVTVEDQIRLWELERNRIKTQEGKPRNLLEPVKYFRNLYITQLVTHLGLGFLYTAFASQADYEYVLNYARKRDVALWENPVKRCFFWQRRGPCEYSWIY